MAEPRQVNETIISVGGVSAGTTLTDYEAVTGWTPISDVNDIGEFGDEANVIEFSTIDSGRTKKAIGTRNAGDLTLTCARIEDDAGQIAMRAAARTSDHYDFRMELTTGETVYFSGPVASARNQLGGSDEILRQVFTIAISSGITEVASV